MTIDDPLAGTTCPPGPEGLEGPPGAEPTPAPKRRGRPRVSEDTNGTISIWVSSTLQDRIIKLANQRKQSVSEYLRDVLIQLFLSR